jgi:hypothetical protein
MTALLVFQDASPQTDLRTKAQNRPDFSRSSGWMLRPGMKAGKALSSPRRSETGGMVGQNPPKSAIYPPIRRLEPDCDLGQKGVLPPGMVAVFGW